MLPKHSWEMNFLFCSPLRHQGFEDLISIPSNGSALVPRLQVKKRILKTVRGLPWGKRQFELPCTSPSGLLTDLRGWAAEDALPVPGSTGGLQSKLWGETRRSESQQDWEGVLCSPHKEQKKFLSLLLP